MAKVGISRCFMLFVSTLCLVGSTITLLISVSCPQVRAGDKMGEEVVFTILHTNDEHSALIPHSPAADYLMEESDPTVGGFARLASAIEEIRGSKERSGEPVLLLSGGDFLGGSAFGWLAPAGTAAELTLMHKMGYDAAVIGNHEYDCGIEVLVNYLLAAGYPEAHEKTAVLATNTEVPSSHPLNALYRTTHLLELDNGLTVGLFGLIGKDAILVAHDTGCLSFIDQHKAASEAVDSLQKAGADVIIALTHAGVEEDRSLARAVPGIHIIVGGHCHSTLEEPIIEGVTIIVQAGSLTKYLGCLEVGYSSHTGEVRMRNYENSLPFLIPIDDRFTPNHQIASLVYDYTVKLNRLVEEHTEGRFNHIMDTVMRSDFILSYYPRYEESLVGNFITDAMRIIAGEKTGKRVDVAIQSNGNIRGSILPGTMKHSRDNISFYDLTHAIALGCGEDDYPGYPLVSFYLSGKELWKVLETSVLLSELIGNAFFLQLSGLRYSFNPTNAVLFTLPFVDLPLLTARAVTRVELYTGEGVTFSGDEGFISLKRNDQDLYHVVTDSNNLSFLPLVAGYFPRLKISPKNADGEPVSVEDFSNFIIKDGDRELKVWQAVVEYAAAQPPGEDGLPRIPDHYRAPAGFINRVETFPFLGWLLIALLLLIGGMVRLRRKHRSC